MTEDKLGCNKEEFINVHRLMLIITKYVNVYSQNIS